MQVRSLGQEYPLEKEMATHSSIVAWKIPWTEEPIHYSSSVQFSCSVMSDSCDPIDCSLPASSVHGILQERKLEWVAIFFSRGSS